CSSTATATSRRALTRPLSDRLWVYHERTQPQAPADRGGPAPAVVPGGRLAVLAGPPPGRGQGAAEGAVQPRRPEAAGRPAAGEVAAVPPGDPAAEPRPAHRADGGVPQAAAGRDGPLLQD